MKTDIAYIYALIDPRDNVVRYVGKTVTPKIRLRDHITESKKVNHFKAKWIRSLLKLNMKPIFKILKICPLSDFIKYETEFIKLYKSDKLTNSDDAGQGNVNRKKEIVEGAAEKISREVYQFDLNGIFIKEFKSTRDAERKLGINHANIVRCCNGVANHAGCFIFKYNRDEIIHKIINPNAAKKQVIEIDKFGNEINRWNSLMDCSRENKINNGNLSRVCNNINKSIKGRIFKFI